MSISISIRLVYKFVVILVSCILSNASLAENLTSLDDLNNELRLIAFKIHQINQNIVKNGNFYQKQDKDLKQQLLTLEQSLQRLELAVTSSENARMIENAVFHEAYTKLIVAVIFVTLLIFFLQCLSCRARHLKCFTSQANSSIKDSSIGLVDTNLLDFQASESVADQKEGQRPEYFENNPQDQTKITEITAEQAMDDDPMSSHIAAMIGTRIAEDTLQTQFILERARQDFQLLTENPTKIACQDKAIF